MALISDRFTRELKTTAWNSLITHYTGEPGEITRHENYNEINYSPEQARKMQEVLDSWTRGEPSDVRVPIKPVLFPWLTRRYGWYAVAILAGGVVLGKLWR